ncbi:MAG: YggT family protein [Gaiellales bacterium]
MSHLVANVVTSFVSVYTLLILAAVILSWARPRSGGLARLRAFVDSMTDPYLRWFRRFVPPIGRLDFSPMAALITLQIVGGGVAAGAASL